MNINTYNGFRESYDVDSSIQELCNVWVSET